jgi:HD domain
VPDTERSELTGWLRPQELALFDAMHVADRRHGLDVVAWLRTAGESERDVLVAGLLHDCGKGQTGVGPRIAYALGRRYDRTFWRMAAIVPGWGAAIERLRVHADASAELAAQAGCSERTVQLIRHQDRPVDPEAGERLRLADEAS